MDSGRVAIGKVLIITPNTWLKIPVKYSGQWTWMLADKKR